MNMEYLARPNASKATTNTNVTAANAFSYIADGNEGKSLRAETVEDKQAICKQRKLWKSEAKLWNANTSP